MPDKFSGGRDIEEFVAKCDIYTKFSRIKHQPVEDVGLPDGLWIELGSDTCEFKPVIITL